MNAHFNASAATTPASLADRAMLASVRIRQWSGNKKDKDASRQLTTDNGATAESARVNKSLVSKQALAKIVNVSNRARDEHYSRTLPWHDDGSRILSAAGYMGYVSAMRELRAEFEAAVREFEAGYAEYVADAVKSLGKLYKPSDYPSAADIARRFSFEHVLTNMPVAADFRVSLTGAEADMIREDIERRTRDAIADAQRDVFQRVADAVGKMAEKLAADRDNGKPQIFRDSMVENVRDLVSLLPSLNVTGNAVLSQLADRMAADLLKFEPDALRDDAAARQEVATAAKAILATVSDFI